MKKSRQFLLNTVILTCSTLLMQLIAVSFNAYLSGKIGSAGIGLYQLILSVYSFAVTFASSGIKLATTRLVVAAMNASPQKKVSTVMRSCICYSICFGAAAAVLLFSNAEWISSTLLSDSRPVLSLKILAASLPFLAASSALCGYFTAMRRISRFAFTQIGEQLLRITVTILILNFFLPDGLTYACASVAVGACLAEIGSCFTLFILYRMDKRKHSLGGVPPKRTIRRLLSIAIPDAVSSYARSALVTIEHLLIPSGLKKSGASKEGALAVYGVVHGMALPIILFPSAFLMALANLLIPEIAEYKERKDYKHINSIVTRVLKYTFLFAIGISGMLWSFSGALGEAIYHNQDVAQFIRLLAPLIPIMYADTAVDGVLKGMGQQVSSMRYNIIDASVSVVLVYLLLPKLAIQGYVITIFVTEILNFYLSISKLASITQFRIHLLHTIVKPILAILTAVLVCGFGLKLCLPAAPAGLYAAAAILLSGALYFLLLRLLSCITRQDLCWFRSIFRRNSK